MSVPQCKPDFFTAMIKISGINYVKLLPLIKGFLILQCEKCSQTIMDGVLKLTSFFLISF